MKTFLKLIAVSSVILMSGSAMAQKPDAVDAVQQKRCTTTTVYFKSAPMPTTPSPQLAAFLAPLHPVGYGVDQPNHAFGDSFRVCGCETCGGKIEIGVRKTSAGDNPLNDDYYVGLAPFGPRVVDGRVWSAGDGASKTLTVNLPAAALNKVLCSEKGCPLWLDVYVEDDTVVDWIKLTILHP